MWSVSIKTMGQIINTKKLSTSRLIACAHETEDFFTLIFLLHHKWLVFIGVEKKKCGGIFMGEKETHSEILLMDHMWQNMITKHC